MTEQEYEKHILYSSWVVDRAISEVIADGTTLDRKERLGIIKFFDKYIRINLNKLADPSNDTIYDVLKNNISEDHKAYTAEDK